MYYKLNDFNEYNIYDRYTKASLGKLFDEVKKFKPLWEFSELTEPTTITPVKSETVSLDIKQRIHIFELFLTQILLIDNYEPTQFNNYLNIIQEITTQKLSNYSNFDQNQFEETYLYLLLVEIVVRSYYIKSNLSSQNIEKLYFSLPFSTLTYKSFIDSLPNYVLGGASSIQEDVRYFLNVIDFLYNFFYKEIFAIDAKVVYQENNKKYIRLEDAFWEIVMQFKYHHQQVNYYYDFVYDPYEKQGYYYIYNNNQKFVVQYNNNKNIVENLVNYINNHSINFDLYHLVFSKDIFNRYINSGEFFLFVNVFYLLRTIAKVLSSSTNYSNIFTSNHQDYKLILDLFSKVSTYDISNNITVSDIEAIYERYRTQNNLQISLYDYLTSIYTGNMHLTMGGFFNLNNSNNHPLIDYNFVSGVLNLFSEENRWKVFYLAPSIILTGLYILNPQFVYKSNNVVWNLTVDSSSNLNFWDFGTKGNIENIVNILSLNTNPFVVTVHSDELVIEDLPTNIVYRNDNTNEIIHLIDIGDKTVTITNVQDIIEVGGKYFWVDYAGNIYDLSANPIEVMSEVNYIKKYSGNNIYGVPNNDIGEVIEIQQEIIDVDINQQQENIDNSDIE